MTAPHLAGLEPTTLQSLVERANHQTIASLIVVVVFVVLVVAVIFVVVLIVVSGYGK